MLVDFVVRKPNDILGCFQRNTLKCLSLRGEINVCEEHDFPASQEKKGENLTIAVKYFNNQKEC